MDDNFSWKIHQQINESLISSRDQCHHIKPRHTVNGNLTCVREIEGCSDIDVIDKSMANVYSLTQSLVSIKWLKTFSILLTLHVLDGQVDKKT